MLASAKPFASVTEGTTNLLDKDVFAQETERVRLRGPRYKGSGVIERSISATGLYRIDQ